MDFTIFELRKEQNTVPKVQALVSIGHSIFCDNINLNKSFNLVIKKVTGVEVVCLSRCFLRDKIKIMEKC